MSASATADPITYQLTYETATVALAGVVHSDANITFILTGDTSSITNPVPGTYLFTGAAAVAASGFQTVTVTSDLNITLQASSGVITLNYLGGVVSTQTFPSLIGYDLATSTREHTNSYAVNVQTIQTSGGPLSFLPLNARVTFAAIPGPLAIPEPSSLALIACGLAAPVLTLARRRRTA